MAKPTKEDLLKDYRKYAKMINQRMLRLERLQAEQYYKGVLTYAYAEAADAARHWGTTSKTGLPRFKESTKQMENMEYMSLLGRVNYLRRLADKPTMTKKGITKTYKERTKTLNQQWGTDYTWQEIANFFEKGIVSINDMMYGSKTIMTAVNKILRKKITPKNVDEKLAEIQREDGADRVMEQVIKHLTDQGLDYKNMFS